MDSLSSVSVSVSVRGHKSPFRSKVENEQWAVDAQLTLTLALTL
jgi:hypothetical protein